MASRDFIAGFAHAVDALAAEGDYRQVDWSAAYQFLKGLRMVMESDQTMQERIGTDDEQVADALAQLREGSDENKIRADTIARLLRVNR